MISVIIPVYNVENYIKDCLTSVLNQTFEDIEVIIINDGSTDKSKDIVEQYVLKDSRIKLFDQNNMGLSAARNNGIEKSSGEYLFFVDSDDMLEENILEELYKIITNYKADIASVYCAHFTNDKKPVYSISKKNECLDPVDAITRLFSENSTLFAAWGKLYTRNLFTHIRFREGIIYEDVEIMPRLFEISNCVVISYSCLYGYRHRDNSITTTSFSSKEFIILDIIDMYREKFNRNLNITEALNCYRQNVLLRLWLNMGEEKEFTKERRLIEEELDNSSGTIIFNKKCNNKLRGALVLYKLSKRFIQQVYPYVNRWK